jgi:hypothetical protein
LEDPPTIESSGGIGDTLKNLPIISWIPFI